MRRGPKRLKASHGNAFTWFWTSLSFVLLAAVPLVFVRATRAIPSARPALPLPMGDHYLLLVNTAIAGQMDAVKLAQFDRSPYDGLAVSFADAYDTAPPVSLPRMKAQLESW